MANLLEEEIVNKIGMNNTIGFDFSKKIEIYRKENDKKSIAVSFYSYEGNLYIDEEENEDIPFDDYEEESQKLIHSEIMKDNYE